MAPCDLAPGILNGRLKQSERVVDNIEEWNPHEGLRAGVNTRIGEHIADQSLHLGDRSDGPVYPVLGLFVQLVFVFQLKELDESTDTAQRGLQIMRCNVGELLQLQV